MLITGLVIKADETCPVEAVEFEQRDLSFMQGVVGGTVDAIDTKSPALTLWIDDEGKFDGAEINVRATLLLWAAHSDFRGRDAIMGDVLLTGTPDDDGDITGISAEVRSLILDTTKFKVEVQTYGSNGTWSGNQVIFTDYWVATQWVVNLAQRWTLVEEVRVIAA